MRISYLLYAMGLVMLYVGIMLFIPVSVALFYHDYFSVISFLSAGILSASIGFLIKRYSVKELKILNLNDIKKSEALFTVVMSWVMFSLIASLPYLWYGLSPINIVIKLSVNFNI